MTNAPTTWVLEPRDTLVVRDGRLAADGVPMRTLPFPWPSSLAGFARTAIGLDASGRFSLSAAEAERLRDVPVHGPWLVESDRADADDAWTALFPHPADCLWMEDADGLATRYRLAPRAWPDGVSSDLPPGLLPVRIVSDAPPKGKPGGPPAFWRFPGMREWLLAPPAECDTPPERLGRAALTVETRVHVALDPETGTAARGRLFSTEGLRFTGEDQARLAIALACSAQELAPRMAQLGGERRLSRLTACDAAKPPFPRAELEAALGGRRRLRLVLVTAAIFGSGHLPAGGDIDGATVVAAAHGRYQVISGWDFAARGPKATRRVVPAGAVYWVDVPPDQDPVDWAEAHWMQPVSDDPQDRRDGFGLALVGVG